VLFRSIDSGDGAPGAAALRAVLASANTAASAEPAAAAAGADDACIALLEHHTTCETAEPRSLRNYLHAAIATM
jgi:hypothetical protein